MITSINACLLYTSAIKRENDKPKLEIIGKELAELKEQEKSFKAKWQSEKTLR